MRSGSCLRQTTTIGACRPLRTHNVSIRICLAGYSAVSTRTKVHSRSLLRHFTSSPACNASVLHLRRDRMRSADRSVGVHHKCAVRCPPPLRYQPLALAGLSITKLLVEALRLPKRGARTVQLLCLSRPSLHHCRTHVPAACRAANQVDLGSIHFGGQPRRLLTLTIRPIGCPICVHERCECGLW